jgi:pantoate ligase / CMP/dCMP kinase
MTQLFTKITELREFLTDRKQIGLIPTMGALHQGHLSLIERSRQQDQVVVVSIFVNKLQFAPTEDFQQYPRQLNQDLYLCEEAGVDIVFAPDDQEIWQDRQPKTLIQPPSFLSEGLCGRSRPGHFIGVATVVVKLLNIVQPDRAYFGQKDAQQLAIIQQMVKDLNLPVEIIPCAIARDIEGMALSSRNQYLNAAEKLIAPQIYASLEVAQTAFFNGEQNSDRLLDLVQSYLANTPQLKLDYLQIVDPHSLQPLKSISENALLAIAVYLGKTRLIDNILLTHNFRVSQ